MFTPYPNHTTELAASLYASCAIVACTEQANPLNAVEATLDVFGPPVVRVCFCDNHYHLFGNVTDEQKIVPDIVIEEQAQ